MSSQLQPKPPSQSPYANIPGYHLNEPANSAWNRTILSYRQAGVPYTIQEVQQPSAQKQSSQTLSASLGEVSTSRSNQSTNPEFESAILESFAKNPEGFAKAGTGYFGRLFSQGVLTEADYSKLNDIVTNYNANVEKQNAKNMADYQKSYAIYLTQKQEALKQYKSSENNFTNFLNQYEKQNATFKIIDKSGNVVGTTSGERSYYDVLKAQSKFGVVSVQPVLPQQQQAEKPFSIKEYAASAIGGIQTALTSGKESNPVNYFIDVGKGIGSFFYQGGKQLAAIAPIIGSELISTIKTGQTQYQIKGSTPLSGFAGSFLQPQLGFTPAQQFQYQSNIKQIDTFIGSVKSAAKSQGIILPSITPPKGSAGGAIGTIIGLGLGLYGTKELAPFRYEKYALPLGETKEIVTKTLTGAPAKEQVPVFSTVYKGITLGYGAGRPLLGSYSGKIALGLKPELLKYPEAAASGTRFELGTGSGFETRIFKSEKTQTYLKQQGLLPERTEKAVTLGMNITKESAKTPQVQFQKGYSFTEEPFLKLQGKEQTGALEFLVSRQSFVKQAGKGTRIGRVHGSLSEIPQAIPEMALKAHDIDVRVSSDVLGVKTAKGLAESLQGIGEKGRTFTSEGKQTILTVGGKEEKIAEFPFMEKAVEYSSATQSSERVFGQKLPSGFKKYSIRPGGPKLKVTPGKFQTLRRSASVFSLKGEKNPTTGKYEFQVGPEEYRLKDVAKLYSRVSSEARANILKGSKIRAFKQESYAKELKDIFAKQINVEEYIKKERLGQNKPEPIEIEPAKSASQQFKEASSGVLSASRKISSPTTISSGSPFSQSRSRNIKDLSGSSAIASKSSSTFESISRPSGSSGRSKPSMPSGISPFRPSGSSKLSSPSKSFSNIASPPSRPPSSPPSNPFSPPSSPPKSPPYTPPSSPPSRPPSSPPYTPPQFPPSKRIPFFWLPNPINGPGNPVFGGGAKKGYIGNVPEYQFTGMYNRIETIYGRARTPKVPKAIRANRGVSNERSFVFGGKVKQGKSLSNKYNKLI